MSAFHESLAEILEIEPAAITPDLDLRAHNWDSLAVVSTLALIDECYGKLVEGSALARCERVADIEALVGTAG
jgi:acyl carrier protein